MNELMNVALLLVNEREADLNRNEMAVLALKVEIERARFLMAFKVRRLLNRFAPTLAPRLGF